MTDSTTFSVLHPFPTFELWGRLNAGTFALLPMDSSSAPIWTGKYTTDITGSSITLTFSGVTTADIGEFYFKAISPNPGRSIESDVKQLTVSSLEFAYHPTNQVISVLGEIPDAPVWGTLPSPDQDDRDYPTDITLDDYCTGATSYSKVSGTGTVSGVTATLPQDEIGGAYQLEVNANNAGGDEPATINWTVNETPPDIDTHPAPDTTPVGSPIQFTSTASHPNTETIIYQWQGETTPGSDSWDNIGVFYGDVSGANTTTVTITPAEGEEGVRNVRLMARSYGDTAANAAYSNTAALTVESGAGNLASMLLTLTTTTSPQTLSFGTQGTNNCTIKWGDGSETPYNGSGSIGHEYATADTYDVEINIDGGGNFSGFKVGNAVDAVALTEISQWGTSVVSDCLSMAHGCSNLVISATDVLNTSAAKSMRKMFLDATNANPVTTDWDTGLVTRMDEMFWDATSATPDTSGWQTGNVTRMDAMFRDATNANPVTTDWDTGNVTSMISMFYRATNATPDTSGWETDNVTSMSSMFNQATNAAPDTSGWNTSNITDMTNMFYYAGDANPDLSTWAIPNMNSMSSMLSSSGFTDANYHAALVNFADQHDVAALNALWWHASENVSVTGAGQDVQDAKARLVESPGTGGAGWTITDKDG